jgi:hypothetical protein
MGVAVQKPSLASLLRLAVALLLSAKEAPGQGRFVNRWKHFY